MTTSSANRTILPDSDGIAVKARVRERDLPRLLHLQALGAQHLYRRALSPTSIRLQMPSAQSILAQTSRFKLPAN